MERNMHINMRKISILIEDKESNEIEVKFIKLEQVKIENSKKQEAEINVKMNTAMKVYSALNKKFIEMIRIIEILK